METVEYGENKATVSFSVEELIVVNAALNEVCNGINLFEFETRIGATRETVRELLSKVSHLIDAMKPDSD